MHLGGMDTRWQSLLALGTSLGCGLIAGSFFAFSTFVMGALARLPAAEGIRAMQAINVVVINRWFLGAMLGTAAACALPRNDALAKLAPEAADAASVWAQYVAGWTAWNHVRSAAALVAAGLLTIALQLEAR